MTADIHKERPDWQVFRDGCPGGNHRARSARGRTAAIKRLRAVEGNVLLFPAVTSCECSPLAGSAWSRAPANSSLLSTASLSALSYEHNLSQPAIRLWDDDRHVGVNIRQRSLRNGHPCRICRRHLECKGVSYFVVTSGGTEDRDTCQFSHCLPANQLQELLADLNRLLTANTMSAAATWGQPKTSWLLALRRDSLRNLAVDMGRHPRGARSKAGRQTPLRRRRPSRGYGSQSTGPPGQRMIDRVVHKLGRSLCEVPVGFKWFVSGLFDGSLCFGGEESAGASFLRNDGTVWTTDKDGPIMDLLAAEITARTGKDPGELYQELTTDFGTPYYTRIDAPATPEQKARLQELSPQAVATDTLAGEPITAKLTSAPGNGAPIGGLKVVTDNGWFAARPSGTENIYKIYAESFKDQNHLVAIVEEAQEIVTDALGSPAPALREQEVHG